MNTTTQSAPGADAHEIQGAGRIAEQLLASTVAEPHARTINALFIALQFLAETHPCCRAATSQLAMRLGLTLACVPEANHSTHVH